MEFRTFSAHEKGYSHEKNGTGCEDYADSYSDPDGKFFICVACDGHSDSNCFRSTKGAEFGCKSAIEILRRFFELLYEEGVDNVKIDRLAEERLKRSIKQLWDQKVSEDIASDPITEGDMDSLSDRVRNYYQSGKGLQNIYGTTFLAVAVCNDFCIALHVGDGVMLFINEDGTYFSPLGTDEKSEMGSPASLCDGDLFTRKNAFRSKISNVIPVAAVVSSDGIGDCMDQYQFMERVYELLTKFASLEDDLQAKTEINSRQENFLQSFVEYYTKKGNGVEDDCSLSGIYAYDKQIPQVKLPLDIAEQILNEAVQERNRVISDYEKRKRDNLTNLRKLRNGMFGRSSDEIIETVEKIESIKDVLGNIVKNEDEKIAFYDEKIRMCGEYVRRAGGFASRTINLVSVLTVYPLEIEADESYKSYKLADDEYQKISRKAEEMSLQLRGEYKELETELESSKKKVERAKRILVDQKIRQLQLQKQAGSQTQYKNPSGYQQQLCSQSQQQPQSQTTQESSCRPSKNNILGSLFGNKGDT